jgi:putative transposase
MKTLRRFDIKNTHYFITCVTYKRKNILLNDIDIFRQSWKNNKPGAWVILPDHFHIIIKVDNCSISDLMHRFKITFSRRYRDKYGSGRVWQNRFWDHIIRNQDDMNKHLDYLHYNPVKHGITKNPFKYQHSSLAIYYERGLYQRDWGVVNKIIIEGDFGE